MSIAVRIKNCIDNHDEYVARMATFSDKELSKKLNLVHIQMQLAEQTKNTGSLELLEIWRTQIIEARIHKAENNIPDTPNEIELAIADMETQIAKSEERQEILKEETKPVPEPKSHIQQQDDDSQLTLF